MNKRSKFSSRLDGGVDVVLAIVLTVLGIAGFQTSFGGTTFVVVGTVAAVLGAGIAYLIHALKLPAIFALAVALVGFILFGAAIAVHERNVAGFVPTVAGATGLVDGAVSGWRRLLTTLPPSGSLGNLLAVPFLCGYGSALVSALLGLKTKLLALLLAPPTAVLSLSILFGTRRPFSIVLQGAVFAGICIAWLALRRGRQRRVYLQSTRGKRLVGGAVMLGLIAGCGFIVGPRLPFAAANGRYVLRDKTVPPFDPRDYGSPLNAYQKFLIGDLKDEVLFTVTGLPQESPVDYVRLAVMDDYDGVVWRVSPKGGSTSGRFIRVGESVPTTATGETIAASVKIGTLPGIWVPDAGVVTGVKWTGTDPRNATLRDTFRLSTQTNTAAVPVSDGWKPGDMYTLDAIVPAQPTDQAVASEGVDKSIRLDLGSKPPAALAALAAGITKDKATPFQQVKALEDFFHKGYYTTGETSSGQRPSAPGHSYGRLMAFVAGDKAPDGNAEQYAATMAVMARALGLPSRVVMGFRVKPGQTEVKGRDVDAWVEIAFSKDGWKRFDPTPRDNTAEPDNSKKKQRPKFDSQQVPPPPIVPPQPESPPTKEGQKKKLPDPPKDKKKEVLAPRGSSHALLFAAAGGVPAALLIVPTSVILLLKRRRRKRRRKVDEPTGRIAGGWQELLDHARDIGLPVAAKSTRREAALMLASQPAETLASKADAAVFGAGQPSDDEITSYWSDVAAARKHLRSSLSPWAKLRASLSTTSLRALR